MTTIQPSAVAGDIVAAAVPQRIVAAYRNTPIGTES
jgi:hypothetical protein